MSESEYLCKKLQKAIKLGGFHVRSDLCMLIVKKLTLSNLQLNNDNIFETCVKNLCSNLENQCLSDRSIEEENIDRAIEICLDSGYDKHETIFNVIDAFKFPKLVYDPEKKLFLASPKKPKLLSDAISKTQLFIDRYTSILQRTKRSFKDKLTENESDRLVLQTVDYLLTLSCETLNRTLILGALIQISESKYFLEDPSGIVQLDLTHAKYHSGFFVENCFVLVNGYYEDKVLYVSTVILPPGEEYKQSKSSFGNINYFGGESKVCLKDSHRLREHMFQNPHDMILLFCDVWLDHPMIFEKFEVLFNGIQATPPAAFVFIGNFLSESYCYETVQKLIKLFKEFGEVITHYPTLITNSNFVFVPGMGDPCTPHILPRLPLPSCISNEMKKFVPNAVFTTNPCRIQYCNREIVVFRADMLAKLYQGTIYKPNKNDIAECVSATIVCQGHLNPLPLNALPVHWDFDYTLRLYPLPDLVIIGDKSETYNGMYKGCHVVNPGPFCEGGFQFKSYVPFNNTLDDCIL